MEENRELATQFEAHRARLRRVAYRMLGSMTEADDALQEAWLHLSRSGANDVRNFGGWLTTVVARVCLDVLRSRKARREEAVGADLPDPIVIPEETADPERDALLADSVGLALLIVLETLAPAERLAFVLHDMFALSFEEIAPMVDRTPAAARQLASRARKRVQGASPAADPDPARQRTVVDAFLTASRGGDLDGLLAVLDPDVLLRSDRMPTAPTELRVVRGASNVARRAMMFAKLAAADRTIRRASVNGTAGIVSFEGGRAVSVMGFTVAHGRIVEIYVLADPARLARLDLGAFGASRHDPGGAA